MRNQVSQAALRGEQDLTPNRPGGYDMDPAFARVHELGVAVIELKEVWRKHDPHLAATAVSNGVEIAHQARPQTDPFNQLMRDNMDPQFVAATSGGQLGRTAVQPQAVVPVQSQEVPMQTQGV